MTNCIYILKRGDKKGEPCGKKCNEVNKYCKKHIVYETNLNGFNVLSNDIINIIVDKLEPNIKIYMALACCNKELYKLMNDEDKYKSLLLKLDIDTHESKLSYKKQLKLYGMIGCELCKAQRIKKVYTEYDIRCCKNCLYENTVSEYKLKDEYLLNIDIFNKCRYKITDMYNPYGKAYNREYTLKFYWKPDVLKVIKKNFGVDSLDEYKNRKTIQIKKSNLVEMNNFLKDKSSGITIDDIDQLTLFSSDTKNIKTMDSYYKDALKLQKEKLKEEFIKSQVDYHDFKYKNEIKNTIYYRNMGRRKKWTQDDWVKIKNELEENERQKEINKLKEYSDKIRVVNIDNLSIDKLRAESIPIINCNNNGQICTFCCNNDKIFKWPGIVDHHRYKHVNIAIKFILNK